ncbi:MAG: hypothetical protein EA397_02195 [Deltaproteobacteria bacterium]|nr:MAG: hypothetical protein EA397_02195 [Deltaproteobacteria bacterium]
MKPPVPIVWLLGLLALPLPAQAIEVESGVRPDQRERVRVSLTLKSRKHEASLVRIARPTLSEDDVGLALFPTISEVCDLPCTVRVPRLELLTVQGDRWSQPVRLQRFRGSDIDLVVRPGRPNAMIAGMILSTMALSMGSLGSSLWITGRASRPMDAPDTPRPTERIGRGLTLGSLGAIPLGLGFMVHGSSGIRQRNRQGQRR